jgi:hypothetical protein
MSSNSNTVTLPAVLLGKELILLNTHASNTAILLTPNSETINGIGSGSMAVNSALVLFSDGVNWFHK